MLQTDGNLVAYPSGQPYWSSGTVGATHLVLKETAPYLSIYKGTALVWKSQ